MNTPNKRRHDSGMRSGLDMCTCRRRLRQTHVARASATPVYRAASWLGYDSVPTSIFRGLVSTAYTLHS
ncbi:uncharacterized protein IUM83_15261 [Phytophthora cinnamomi]|uniref:uncharacterized protein n=1 Tax=Phytophthora cinnamomi TaxID=4785 RepID=UPI00355ACD6D|nr:hypothetical protein IUM83_15261 [Phytophthora cinnamomi]